MLLLFEARGLPGADTHHYSLVCFSGLSPGSLAVSIHTGKRFQDSDPLILSVLCVLLFLKLRFAPCRFVRVTCKQLTQLCHMYQQGKGQIEALSVWISFCDPAILRG